jgi:hypothetical protein
VLRFLEEKVLGLEVSRFEGLEISKNLGFEVLGPRGF